MRTRVGGERSEISPVKQLSDEAIRFENGRYVLACNDGLGRDALAGYIAAAIPRLRPPFTVAVYGGCGEGKTHLLKSVELKIQKLKTPGAGAKKFRTIWFDPWQYQSDANPIISMLQVARDESRANRNFGEIARSVGEVLGALLMTTLDASWAQSSIGQLRVNHKQYRNEQLKMKFAIQEERVRLHSLFRKALDALTSGGPLVFFIDSLDRCLPEQIVNLLESIQLYLNHEKCIFIIGVDDSAVVRAISEVKHYDSPEVATHYLEKMVQYAFDLPPVEAGMRNDFIYKKLKAAVGEVIPPAKSSVGAHTLHESGKAPQKNQIGAIVKLWNTAFNDLEVAATVRLMVRTVNTFAIDHAIGLSQLKDDYDPMIMAVLSVIRTCHREAFSRLRHRPSDRTESLWKLLFEFDDESKDKRLESLFSKDNEQRLEDKESDPQSRLGYAFVQAVQALMGSGVQIDDNFAKKVEAHFRLASAAKSDLVFVEQEDTEPENTEQKVSEQKDTLSVPGKDEVTRLESWGATTKTPTTKSDLDDSPTRSTPLQVDILDRLPGIVDYFSRRQATEEEVAEVCEQIRSLDASSSRDKLVNLSGIQWRVLDVVTKPDNDKWALLLSEHVLGTGPYNKDSIHMAWDRCDLRWWLKDEFKKSLGGPFTRRIIQTSVENESNPVWEVDGGKSTNDWIFLLSLEEAAQYLAGQHSLDWNQYKEAHFQSEKLTAYDEEGESQWWWLRSPGITPLHAAAVSPDGDISVFGSGVDIDNVAVRPALWFNLDA